MFSFGVKEKLILFSILCIPFLIINILYYYCLWIPANSWFFNADFLRMWFYIIFLIFVFIPFSKVILFKKGTILQRILLLVVFFFLGVDIVNYSWEWIDLDQIFVTFILIIFLNFSSNLLNFPKVNLKKIYKVSSMILIAIASALFITSNLISIDYLLLSISYILIIGLIISFSVQ